MAPRHNARVRAGRLDLANHASLVRVPRLRWPNHDRLEGSGRPGSLHVPGRKRVQFDTTACGCATVREGPGQTLRRGNACHAAVYARPDATVNGDIGTNSPAASNCRVGGAGAGGASRAESLRCLVDHCGLDHSGARRVGAGDRSGTLYQGWQDHAPRSAYAYTLCRDGWISHSQGPGTCSWHHQAWVSTCTYR